MMKYSQQPVLNSEGDLVIIISLNKRRYGDCARRICDALREKNVAVANNLPVCEFLEDSDDSDILSNYHNQFIVRLSMRFLIRSRPLREIINERRSVRLSHAFDEKETLSILRQLAKAIMFFKKKLNIVHGNITPDTVYVAVEQGRAELFGLDRFCEVGQEILDPNDVLDDSTVMSSAYVPPEQLRDSPSSPDSRADVWQLGCTVFEMVMPDINVYGTPSPSIEAMKTHIEQQKEIPLPSTDRLGPLIPQLLGKMLKYRPEYRIPLDEIIALTS